MILVRRDQTICRAKKVYLFLLAVANEITNKKEGGWKSPPQHYGLTQLNSVV